MFAQVAFEHVHGAPEPGDGGAVRLRGLVARLAERVQHVGGQRALLAQRVAQRRGGGGVEHARLLAVQAVELFEAFLVDLQSSSPFRQYPFFGRLLMFLFCFF
jgi:hypothetical protein